MARISLSFWCFLYIRVYNFISQMQGYPQWNKTCMKHSYKFNLHLCCPHQIMRLQIQKKSNHSPRVPIMYTHDFIFLVYLIIYLNLWKPAFSNYRMVSFISSYYSRGRCGSDRMVVGFITIYVPLTLWVQIPPRLGVLNCDKVSQWH